MTRRRTGAAAATAAAVAAAVVYAAGSHGSGAVAAPSGAAPGWQAVAPIFAQKCAGCHSAGDRAVLAHVRAQRSRTCRRRPADDADGRDAAVDAGPRFARVH